MNRTAKMVSVATFILAGMSEAGAEWNAFVIRNATVGGNSPAILDNSTYGLPAKEFIITEGGQKVAWGSSSLDGHKLGEIASVSIKRLDARSRFTAGSGPYVAPYINLWITDGAGKYAVIANEPSDAIFQPLYNNGYNLTFADLANKPAKVFETSDTSWLPKGGVGLTFADLANFVVQAPSAAELAAGWPGLGTGAPRELGTNAAYGFNWVFGDSLSNYVSGAEGYVVAQPVANPFVTTQYLVSPASLAAGKPQFSPPHGTGTNPFGYDWDSAAPLTAAGAPMGYGAASFYAAVAQTGATQADRYRTLRIGLRTLFGRNVAIGEVKSLSYYTKKPAPQTAIDWRLSIYTTWDPAGDNMSSWYRNRIQNHPSGALNLNAPANEWNLWSTAVGTNQMLFATNRPGFTAENIALSELAGGPVTRGSYTWDFSNEEIMMFDLTLGANSGGGTGESQLDGVRIELTTGEIADIDLTAPPSDVLTLNVQPESIYLKPGESLVVNMDVSSLAQKVNACQALLGYNSNFFEVGSVAPGGGAWDELIYQSWALAGEINTAIGVDAQGSVGTDADGTVAKITMTAKSQQGTTRMVFLPDVSDVKGTYLSNMSAEFVYPTKIDSRDIVIDGTPPAITCPADATVECTESTDPSHTGEATATDANGAPTITYTDSSTVTVTPGNLDGWTMFGTVFMANTPGGDGLGELVNGPSTPPMGQGSAHLFTGSNGGQSAQLRHSGFVGTRIADLTVLKYSTYATQWNGGQLPWLRIWVDTNNDGTWDDRLNFEPAYSGPGFGGSQPAASLNTWQTWDAIAGKWYSDQVGGPGVNAKTLAQYLALKPDARIAMDPEGLGAMRIASGFASAGDVFNTYVDAVMIGTAAGTTSYNFELGGCSNRAFTRTWTATDLAGNVSTCPQVITVQDTTAPVLSIPADVALECSNLTGIVIDGVKGSGEWEGAQQISVASGKGTVSLKSDANYLYVLLDLQDTTDARLGQNLTGNDQVGLNIDPTDGGSWGFPYGLIFQTGSDPAAWGGGSSGDTDGWKSQLKVNDVVQPLPGDLLTKTLYAPTRVSEWRIPLSLVGKSTGNAIKVGGAADIGDGNSYAYPVGLNWNSAATFADYTLAVSYSSGVATATDNCDPAPIITFIDSEVSGACGQARAITRTWTATDACGNSSNAVQTITVQDTTAPVLSIPADATLECSNLTGIVIDGVKGPGEWDGAQQITVASSKGTVSLKSDANYLYVLFDLNDTTDARTTYPNEVGNDEIGLNIDPMDGGAWGFPYGLILQTSAAAPHQMPWNPKVSSGDTDGWVSRLLVDDVQVNLPADLLTKTLYNPTRVSEWRIPLSLLDPKVLGETIKVGGAADIGDGGSYVFPVGLNWNSAATFADYTLAVSYASGVATATDNCDPAPAISYSDVVTPGDCGEVTVTRTWTATDACGNSSNAVQTINVVDTTDPVVAIASTQQNAQNLLGSGAPVALQGAVEITVTGSDNCCLLTPVVKVTDAASNETTLTAAGGPGTWTYTFAVLPTTANGVATITATLKDGAGNESVATAIFTVDKNQVTGTVGFATLRASAIADPPSPADYTFQRVVTFVATDAGGAVLKTWTPTLSFTNNPSTQMASAGYTLTGVPGNTARLSAKTAWALRKRLDVTLDADGQASAAFVLLGGDINGTNSINVLDYSVLKTNWSTSNAEADINGDGQVWSLDYSLLKANWFQVGDPQ